MFKLNLLTHSFIIRLPFLWDNHNTDVLRRMSFGESGMNVSDMHSELAELGLSTNVLPVQGLTPGTSKVTVQLQESGCVSYHVCVFIILCCHINIILITVCVSLSSLSSSSSSWFSRRSSYVVPPTSVLISVSQPLYLSPTLARIAPNSQLQYILQTRIFRDVTDSQGGAEPNRRLIAMPSPQYKWSCSDTTAVHIHTDLGLLCGVRVGHSKVYVADVNLKLKDKELLYMYQKEADVYVLTPVAIEMTLVSLNTTRLVLVLVLILPCSICLY